ncbi:tail fiber domain-containing protein (plasmid) [Azospirillum sp. A26]|uniref:tail fiber domain-containing protein n=1 Tax=Azospirillum sp. A26 TaxID=3160607 RepID=UPI00366DFA46
MDPSVRPQFFDGQYIGADDLEAIGAYGDARLREHLLGGHSWGIAAGLDIVEKPRPDGAVDAWVQPGYGWDGYGRVMTVRSPVPVAPDALKGFPSGAWFVWLAYRETGQSAARAAYGLCEGLDLYLRVMESCELRVTGDLRLDERVGGVAFGGATRPDPRLVRRVFDPAGPFLCDGSVPEQGAPPGGAKAVWLLPLGLVGWDSGTGRLRPLAPPERLGARTLRRYAGAVAESILAPGGLLRLRPRLALAQGKTDGDVDAVCAERALGTADLVEQDGRALPRDLVWVEGHLRAYGDARLFGGRLELRGGDGGEPQGPFTLGRRDAIPTVSQELEVAIGTATGAGLKNRLIVGPVVDANAAPRRLRPVLAVEADGRVGVGTATPDLTLDVKGDFGRDDGPATVHLQQSRVGDAGDGRLVLTAGARSIVLGDADHHVGINTAAPSPAFALEVKGTVGLTAVPAAVTLLDSTIRDGGDGVLRIASGGNTVAFDGGDRVGIGTDAPAGDLLLDVKGGIGSSQGPAFVRLLGSLIRDGGDGVLRIASGGATVAFDGNDRVGIGTAVPAATLDVAGTARFGNDVTVYGQLYSTGTFWPPSDSRLKNDVTPIDDALATLLRLRGVRFVWRPDADEDQRPQVGMLADEVETIFPQWVREGPDGLKRMSARGFEGLAVEAFRELDRRVRENDALAGRVEELEGRIARLEAALAGRVDAPVPTKPARPPKRPRGSA